MRQPKEDRNICHPLDWRGSSAQRLGLAWAGEGACHKRDHLEKELTCHKTKAVNNSGNMHILACKYMSLLVHLPATTWVFGGKPVAKE